jgi:hypothetical protein
MQHSSLRRARREVGGHRRGVSGLGLLLVVVGALLLVVAFSTLLGAVGRFWPLVLIGVGLFGLLRRPGWVSELDLGPGPAAGRSPERPRRLFSWLLVGLGAVCLPFTLQLVDARVIGPALLIGIGVLLVWRRAR